MHIALAPAAPCTFSFDFIAKEVLREALPTKCPVSLPNVDPSFVSGWARVLLPIEQTRIGEPVLARIFAQVPCLHDLGCC